MRHSKFASLLLVSSLTASASSLMTEGVASACGGCFAPPVNNTVVTDHRMILAIGSNETTLYDQIRYQGSPESFAWVLPIRGEVKVGVSSDAVFSALDDISSVQIVAPPQNCPGRPDSCNRYESAASDMADASLSDNGGVTVLRRETVGPYETVQLRSTDPEALNKWLAEKGYRITPETEPVIASYVAENFDFLALKLVPGKSVTSMKPVRVSMPGASPVLPLRMVAAGAGASVGITLWTLGDGRWEPQNFPKFVVNPDELVWTWALNSSNYKEVRARTNGALGGSAWEIESSITSGTSSLKTSIRQIATYDPRTMGFGSLSAEYPPVIDETGTAVSTEEQNFEDDMGRLFGNKNTIRVTRMRADLPQASLAKDLLLQASQNQGEVQRQRVVKKEADQPRCPVYIGCDYAWDAPRDEAVSRSGGCSVGPDSDAELVGSIAVLGIAVFARRRNKSKAP